MDPQKLSQLDPKLRDAYQRVMGTVIPEPQAALSSAEASAKVGVQAQTPPDPNLTTPQPLTEPQSIPTPTPTIPETTPLPAEASAKVGVSEPQPAINPQPEPAPTQPTSNFVQMNSEVPSQNFTAPPPITQTQTMALKKKGGMIKPVLFGIVGLIFIVIYALFWTKLLNFKLPFRLPFLP